MRKIVKYIIYPITFCYVNGIFFGKYITIHNHLFLVLGSLLLLLFIWLFIRPFRLYSKISLGYLFVFCATFFLLGIFQYQKHNKVDVFPKESTFYTISVEEKLRDNKYSHRYYATIYHQEEKIGKVLIYQDINREEYQYGDILYDKFFVQPIAKASIPLGFDYRDYLKNKGIYAQAYLTESCMKVGINKDFMYYLYLLRKKILDGYASFYTKTEDKALIAGLLFGQRQDLSHNLVEAYRNVGVMHLLAVSGMHTMILFVSVRWFLSLFVRNKRLQYFLIILALVLFALLSGLSASVVRAVLMCTLFLIGQLMRRKSSTVHTLVVSMLIILWFSPNFLFDVGFQLSYLAVFSIVFIYPVIRKYFSFKNKVFNYFAEIIGVSLSVQMGVSFLSIFYFEQFPIWFLLGNLVAIPITSFVLMGLILQLIFNFIFSPISEFLTFINSTLLSLSNDFLMFLNSWETKVVNHLYISIVEMIIYTSAVFLFFGYLRYKKVVYIYAFILCFITHYSVKIYHYHFLNDEGLYIIGTQSNVDFVSHRSNEMQYYSTGDFSDEVLLLKDKWNVKNIDTVRVKNYLQLNQSYFIIDSLIYDVKGIRADVVVLKDNSKINIERMINESGCSQVIIHSNNSFWRREMWKEILDKKNIPYHDMREKGYVLMK